MVSIDAISLWKIVQKHFKFLLAVFYNCGKINLCNNFNMQILEPLHNYLKNIHHVSLFYVIHLLSQIDLKINFILYLI